MPSRIVRPPLVALLSLVALFPISGLAATFCVSDAATLDQALIDASSNGQSDEVRLRLADFHATFPRTLAFRAVMHGSEDLVISGGWTGANGGCSSQAPSTAKTRLLGPLNAPIRLLQIDVDPGASGTVRIRRLNFTSAISSETGSCLRFSGTLHANSVGIEIDDNEFLGCQGLSGSAAYLLADAGPVRFRGNLVYGTSDINGSGAVFIDTQSADAFVSNNTFRDNNAATAAVSALRVDGAAVAYVSNNVFVGDATYDLWVSPNTVLIRNIFRAAKGTPGALSNGNLHVDPRFAKPYGAALRLDSPARNTGSPSPFGGSPDVDLDGYPRTQENALDRGALEVEALFGNGFE